MKIKNIKITENKKIERFNKIKKNRETTRFHILMLVVITLIYILTFALDICMIKYLKWYNLNSFCENLFVILTAILFFSYFIYWCVKIVKLDKEKKQLLNGYKIIEFLNYASEVDYLEYAKYLGFKPEIDYNEIKKEDIELFNLTDKNRQKRKQFSKLYNTIIWVVFAIIFGSFFIWVGFENVLGEIFGAISLIFGFILIAHLIISFAYVAYLDKKYEKLILSYDYRKYIRYKNEEKDKF